MKRTVAVNENGKRIGEDHHRAKLTNHEVELIREMHEGGWGYGRLAAKFDVAKSTIQYLCNGQRRNQAMFGVKTLVWASHGHDTRRKLTADQAREARKLHADGMSVYALAKRFGVDQNTIGKIVKRLGYNSETQLLRWDHGNGDVRQATGKRLPRVIQAV